VSHPPAIPIRIKAVAIMGATATGKSNLAIRLADLHDGEVISMDSRQVYRGLDIGTGKVSAAERSRVPHHLLDILDVNENGSAGRHAEAAEAAIRDIAARGRLPILAGGTGLYFRALFGGLVPVVIPPGELARIRETFSGRETALLHAELERVDPARAAALSPNDRVRVTRALELFAYTGKPASELYARPRSGAADITYLKLVLTMPRELLRAKIEARTHELFSRGWVTEVWKLLDRGVSPEMPGMQSLGYATIAAAIAGGLDPRRWEKQVVTLTRQYAKRQETYFRSEKDAVWIDVSVDGMEARAVALVRAFLHADAPQ
jgi:tRNA dimethylallyltransferase